MKREKREQLLKDTLICFAPLDRYVTDEKGIRYYREDVTLKAMELSENSLPPADATAEEILNKYWTDPTDDQFNCALKAMHEFAAQRQPQPTADGAEEILKQILAELWDEPVPDDLFDEERYILDMADVKFVVERFATLHAQRIADKMVSERLREELLRYLKWYLDFGYEDMTDEMLIDTYLEGRDNHE